MKLKTRVFELCNGKYPGGVGLAQTMGISKGTICRVRKGERGIHERFIIGAIKAFPGYTLDDLFYVSEDQLVKGSNNLRQGAREIMAGFLARSSTPVQCGAMTVIWVSILPLEEDDAYGTGTELWVRMWWKNKTLN